MKIRVNKTGIKNVGKQLSTDAEKLHSEAQKINSIINELAGYWEGADRNKVVGIIKDTYLINMEKAKKRIGSYGEYLQKVPGVYDTLDNAYMKKKIK